ncbi:MAG TPA: tRNA (adenosine(37)-N6)-dimethylallyltransferase MiaA [Desulfuromonadales bacterium]|nr:tRNA (adenosine(37)-N6)-dimethylallyltransferase MiaA [Desulfuromonadales bacterium]
MEAPSQEQEAIPLVVICGPTASGKTALSLELAASRDIEIISADSRQVFRRMDIGTAKATPTERQSIPHHLVDVVAPDEAFSAADFIRLGRHAAKEIWSRGRLPVVVGGTGLYIRGLTEGLAPAPGADEDLRRQLLRSEDEKGEGTLHRRLQDVDPVLAQRLSPRDLVRIVRGLEVFLASGRPLSDFQQSHRFADAPFRVLTIGVTASREELCQRIDARVERMFADGLLDEVRALLDAGYAPGLKSMRTIGYREGVRHLGGELSYNETIALIQQQTRRYAKRQMTWFRKEKSIIWVDSLRESVKIQPLIDHFMSRRRSG